MNNQKKIIMNDINGNPLEYELLDFINLNDVTYAILYPENPNDNDVEIFKIIKYEDENAILAKEEDDNVITKVYNIFKSNNKNIIFKD